MANQDDLLQIEKDIDWMCFIAGNGRPASMSAWKAPVYVGLGLIPAWRGWTGAADCVNYAVLFAWIGTDYGALSWLKAGQHHNSDAKARFDNNSDYALDYAKKKYTLQAAIKFGLSWLESNHKWSEQKEWISNNKAVIEKKIELTFNGYVTEPSVPNDLLPEPPPSRPGSGAEPRGGGGRRGGKEYSDFAEERQISITLNFNLKS